jgi:hypothetical protein
MNLALFLFFVSPLMTKNFQNELFFKIIDFLFENILPIEKMMTSIRYNESNTKITTCQGTYISSLIKNWD